MSKYKNQHHVPKFLLENFKGDNGLYYFNKSFPHKAIAVRNPKSIFKTAHLYTYLNEDNSAETEVESNFLKDIDRSAAPVVTRIVEALRSGTLPFLSVDERLVWDRFFVAQFLRSRSRIENGEAHISAQDFFAKAIEKLRPFGEISPKLSEQIRELQKNSHRIIDRSVKESVKLSLLQTRSILAQRGLAFVYVSSPKSLLIGSNPLIRMTHADPNGNRGNGHLADLRTEFWLPIAKDVAVSPGDLMSRAPERIFHLGTSNSRDIRRLNANIFKNSDEIASSSYSLLHSLVMKSQYHKCLKN